MINHSKLIIISGPSGAGKSTLCKEAIQNIGNIFFSISHTTRNKRNGEIDGVHYHFISKAEFEDGIKQNLYLEYAKVHDNYYGTQRKQIQNALEENKIVIFDIDVQGKESIKKIYPESTTIFITTQNRKTLEDRLIFRASDSEQSIQKRLLNAHKELEYIHSFDYVIINDNIKEATEGFLSIIRSIGFKNSKSFSNEIYKNW